MKSAPQVGRSSPKIPPQMYPTGSKGFFAWMKHRNPRLFTAVLDRIRSPGALSGLGLDPTAGVVLTNSSAPVSSDWASKLSMIVGEVGKAYLTAEQLRAQRKVMDLQLKRAEAGLAPLDVVDYNLGPTATVGISPDTKSLLIYGAAGLAAVFLISRFIKR